MELLTTNHDARTDSTSTGLNLAEQELTIFYRDQRSEIICEIDGGGFGIDNETGAMQYEVQGCYPDGSMFSVPQAAIEKVINNETGQEVKFWNDAFPGSPVDAGATL